MSVSSSTCSRTSTTSLVPFPGFRGPALNPEEHTENNSSADETRQILGTFLKSCAYSSVTDINSTIAVGQAHISSLPPQVLERILRPLLISPTNQAVILSTKDPRPVAYRTHLQPSVLQTSKLFYHMGLPILYGENTFTASSPSTSYGFDESLTHLPGKIRQCITSVRLDIDWADELWAKFPLLTKQLGELRSLQELEIFIKKPESRTDGSAAITMKNPVKRGGVLIEKDVNRTLEERQIVEKRVKMEGTRTSVLLNAEKKMFRELINGSGALRLFRLVGFADPVFAKRLEDMVNRRYLGRVE